MKEKTNLLVIDGGTVKAEENGVVGGMGIVFGSPEQPDRTAFRDFFTNDSFINRKTSFEVPLFYGHGLGLYDEQIGDAVITKGDEGWEVSAKLDLEIPLAQRVYEEVKSKPHGFSSGALAHLIKRIPKENDTNWLKKWVVGEMSIVPRPGEARAQVTYVKSVDDELVYEEAFVEEPVKQTETVEVPTEEPPTWEKVIKQIETVLNFIKENTKDGKVTETEALEQRIVTKLQGLLGEKDTKGSNDEIAELKSQLDAKENELADLKTAQEEWSTREEALTADINRLRILAGAKETIDKIKENKNEK